MEDASETVRKMVEEKSFVACFCNICRGQTVKEMCVSRVVQFCSGVILHTNGIVGKMRLLNCMSEMKLHQRYQQSSVHRPLRSVWESKISCGPVASHVNRSTWRLRRSESFEVLKFCAQFTSFETHIGTINKNVVLIQT